MSLRRAWSIALLSLFLAVSLAAIAFADEYDQEIRFTINQPIAVPDQVLPAGTYWFALAAHGQVDRVMQIKDADRKHVVATVVVVPAETLKNKNSALGIRDTSSHVVFTIADRSPDRPLALLTLTYPGRVEGHAFTLRYGEKERDAMAEYPQFLMKAGKNGILEKFELDSK